MALYNSAKVEIERSCCARASNYEPKRPQDHKEAGTSRVTRQVLIVVKALDIWKFGGISVFGCESSADGINSSCKVRAQLSVDGWAKAGAVASSQIVGDLIVQRMFLKLFNLQCTTALSQSVCNSSHS